MDNKTIFNDVKKDAATELMLQSSVKLVDNYFYKRRVKHIMKLFGAKKITVDSANVIDLMLEEVCDIHLVYRVALKMLQRKNSKTDSFMLNFEIVLSDCVKFGYMNVTFTTLAEMISAYGIIPEAWMIDMAVNSKEELPEYSTAYYKKLTDHPNIMMRLIKDLNEHPSKYRHFPTSTLYDSLNKLKELDYNWVYASAVLVKHRPSMRHTSSLLANNELRKLLMNLQEVLDGGADVFDEDTSRSILMAMSTNVTDTSVVQPKKKTESIHIDIAEGKDTEELEN
jgi:hypothetical protein